MAHLCPGEDEQRRVYLASIFLLIACCSQEVNACLGEPSPADRKICDGPAAYYGAAQLKFAASSMLPLPLYRAT